MSGKPCGVPRLPVVLWPIDEPVVVRSGSGDRWLGILEAVHDGVVQLRGARKMKSEGYQTPEADLAADGVKGQRWGEEPEAGRIVTRQWVRGWTEIVPMTEAAYRTVDASWVPAVPS